MPKLPDFPPIPKTELREFYRRYQDNEDVRRLILELQRARNRFIEIENIRQAIERAWRAEVGGQLAGLYELRLLLKDEISRGG